MGAHHRRDAASVANPIAPTRMAMFRIPAEAYLWTVDGPWRAADIPPSTKLVVIGPDGRPLTSSVCEITEPSERQVVRLLTSSGEIHLDEGSSISTRGAQMFAATALSETLAGHAPRIELAHPRSLPSDPPDPDLAAATRHALALVDPPVVRVPRGLSADINLRRLLDATGIRYTDASDDRWTAFAFNPTDSTPSAGPAGPVDAEALQALTAWTARSPDITICRTTMSQARLRTRLIAALAAAGTPASVTWTPAYGPVEARISASPGDVFTTVVRACTVTMACIDIEIEDEGSAITDLAIVRARRPREGD